MKEFCLCLRMMLILIVLLSFNQCQSTKMAGKTGPVAELPKPMPKPEPRPEPKPVPSKDWEHSAKSRPEATPYPPPVTYGEPSKASEELEIFMFTQFPTNPVPKPSAEVVITKFLSKADNLGDVNSILSSALDQNKYLERKYMYVPGGFALITQLERIDANGYSATESARWNVDIKIPFGDFNIKQYLNALFKAQKGYYRCIVFIVTSKNFQTSGSSPSRAFVDNWLKEGFIRLPLAVEEWKFTKDYIVAAEIYEFTKPENGMEVTLMTPASPSGYIHLTNSGILKILAK